MKRETDRIVIRDFVKKDAKELLKIINQKSIKRYMADWSEYNKTIDDVYKYIEWMNNADNSKDIKVNKRYAVALKDTDLLIGMVGMGLEDTVNEVEVAYFISEEFQRKGYATEAVNELCSYCFFKYNIDYLILTIDCSNKPSYNLGVKCGFIPFEKRQPLNHNQPNMESKSYFYFRKYRE